MDQLFTGTPALRRLDAGPFAPFLEDLDDIARRKLDEGYAQAGLKEQVRVVADLGDWLERDGSQLDSLTDDALSRFLHLKHGRYLKRGLACVVRELVERLRDRGVCPAPVEACRRPSESLLQEYKRYLLTLRGLSASTVATLHRFAETFVSDRFGPNDLHLQDLCAQDVVTFVQRQARKLSTRSAASMVTALRSFLRFLLMRGEILLDLAAAVPAVANWRLQGLPKGLEEEEVEELLRHCSSTTTKGRRDYAILLLLARLGLRSGDIVHLRLDDINWQAGEIVLCGKGKLWHRLPIPHDVGQAMADYLRHGRPACSQGRAVFVRARAPYQQFSSSVAICNIVRSGLKRAGLTPPRRGAHLLRHALATRMLHNGATLGEIGRILRHQRVDTTAIYAKVDVNALRALAQPWPGGEA